jgi:addiction module HigA family antidote
MERERPPRPGQILTERYLTPLRISTTKLAGAAGLSRKHLSRIINGRVGVTAESAVRLGRALGTGAEIWLALQSAVDLFDAEHDLPPDAVQPLPNAGDKYTPAQAAARLVELRKGKSLPADGTLKELISLGRD